MAYPWLHPSRRQEEGQSDYSYGSRNVSYQPSATPLDPPAPLDYPVEDQASQEEFPTDPQTPGGHDFQNAPDPYEEKNFPLADKGTCMCAHMCVDMCVCVCVCVWICV